MSQPLGITVGPNNAIWFTESGVQQIGTFQTAVLTVARTGTGSGSGLVTSDVPLGGAIQCTPAIGNCSVTYMTGLPITLTASAGPGTIFTGWSGGGCSGTAPCTVTLGGDTTVTANFDIQTFPLTVALTGDGSGSVTSTPAAIDCGAVCSANFNSGTSVTLTANPAAGSTFIGWGGACSGTAPCNLTISGPTTVTAGFTQFPVLTVSESGNGTVTSSPSGINCGPGASQCAAGFAPGTPVTLTAAPGAGAIFAGWAGGGCSGTDPCTVTLTAPTAVSATFVTPGAAVLTVSESGDGTVTSSPPGINCGPAASQCSVGFPPGQVVSLTATPGAGSAFAGWGGACSGTGGCALTLTSATTVTASFAALPPPTSTLSIVLAGTGSGTVSSNPSGISCGMTCSASFQTGTQIVISAAAAASSTFAGWSGGGCVGITPAPSH